MHCAVCGGDRVHGEPSAREMVGAKTDLCLWLPTMADERETAISRLFGVKCNAVGAPAISRNDMLRTFNDNPRSKNRSEEVQFL